MNTEFTFKKSVFDFLLLVTIFLGSLNVYSEEVARKIMGTTPVATAATEISATSFVANWVSDANSSSITIYEKRMILLPVVSFIYVEIGTYSMGIYHSCTVSNLQNNCDYKYSVKGSYILGGTYGPSNEIFVHTQQNPPVDAPITNVTYSSFTANWIAAPGATSYSLNVTDDETQNLIYGGLTVNGTSKTFTGLKPNHSYSYAVRSVNGDIVSAIGSWNTVMTLPFPAPTALVPSTVSSTYCTLNWTSIPGATYYRINMTDDETQEFVLNGFYQTATSHVITGLKPDHSYSYAVRAGNRDGESAFGSWNTFRTLPFPAPTALVPTSVSSTSCTLNWTSIPGATYYRINMTDDETQEFILNGIYEFFTMHVITGLKPDHLYRYAVLAGNRDGESAIGNWIEFGTFRTGIEELSSEKNIKIFPCPASDFIQVSGLNKNEVVDIISVTGRVVKTLKAINSTENIDIRSLNSGIYFVRVDSNFGISKLKFIKE